jgi:ergothioneine biosynthesis protein EgtB
MTVAPSIDRPAALDWYRKNRGRSERIFGLIPDEAYFDRPIALRNPICFYEGHIPAFGVNTLVKRALGEPAIDPGYEVLFERGIDPDKPPDESGSEWPSRSQIRAYARRADSAIERAIEDPRIAGEENGAHPSLARGLALYTVLEHEIMHQETLLYMWRRLPFERKRGRDGIAIPVAGPSSAPPARMIRVPAGRATLGVDPGEIPFAWDNELPRRVADVPAFEIGIHDVTNQEFLEFVEAGGYGREELWDPEGWTWVRESGAAHPSFWAKRETGGRDWEWIGMFERLPLPPAWPVWVTQVEASAYARWKGMRLPTEPEYHRAAYGTPEGTERRQPWGDAPPDETRGNFDFQQWEPVAVGSFPAGASAWGIHDLVGNGWEWTSTPFEPFPGFQPMASYPVYSTDFFDGKHYVMKGASPVTGRELVRRSFRNWFRPNYPHVYATFRCVREIS